MQELLTDNIEIWLVLPFTVLGCFASALVLKPCLARRLLLVSLTLIVLTEVCFIAWGIKLRLARAASTEKPKPGKVRPGPAPQPSPKETEVRTEEEAAADGVPFNLTSRGDPSIRRNYCIDSDISGRFYAYSGQIRVRLDTADFDLCKYSTDNQREVQFRLGIGKRGDIVQRNWRGIAWGKSQKGLITAGQESSSQLAPEESIPIPLNRRLKNKSAADLADYGIVVWVYNRDRKGQYYLTDDRR